MNKKNILIFGEQSVYTTGGKEEYARKLIEKFGHEYNFYFLYTNKNVKINSNIKKLPVEEIYCDLFQKSFLHNKPKTKTKKICFLLSNALKYKSLYKKFFMYFNELISKLKIDLVINNEIYNIPNINNNIPIITIQHLDDKYYCGIWKLFKSLFYSKNDFNIFVAYTNDSLNKIKLSRLTKKYSVALSMYDKKEIEENSNHHNKINVIYTGAMKKIKNINFLKEVSNKLEKDNSLKINFYGRDQGNFFNKKDDNYFGEKKPSEIKNILKNTKILVLAGFGEGFSYSVVEALSFGVPCVVLNSYTNAKYLIGNNERGILVNNLNIDEFTKAIMKIVNMNKKEYQKLSEQCTNFALENLTNELFFKKWSTIIKDNIN